MTIEEYIKNINDRYKRGNATEHTFRGDLQQLIESLVPSIRATNEPKRQKCGAPDFILTKKDIPVGFIEAKDIGDNDLDGAKKTGNKEQFDRYKLSLNNLLFTDYIDFHLYRDGQFVTKIAIGELTDNGIKPLSENFAGFENLLKDFCLHIGQSIKSPKKLAEMMAGKARLLSDVIEKALTSDETHNEDSTLKDQINAFKQILIHDITPKGFADVYAQTIAYGMFAARYHDDSLSTFSRQEAYELIPKSNPFLKKLFGYIAGLDVDDRIKWIVDDLINIFLACDVAEILKNFGQSTKTEDPIIHFYETFLSEYDPNLRKARGVWYTPAPVVNFIVRAVDDILKSEFDLPQGLADNSKLKIKNYELGIDKEVHKVQILDPATGTGTFLAEVVKHIHKKFEGQQGIWSNYVETHLLPRLNGFELLMASYAMAHLKLDMLLTETGFKATSNQRLRIYLTNSLEEYHPDTDTFFANWLSAEANEANQIKRDTPVMVIMGNPPYAVSSSNASIDSSGKKTWIGNLIADYKKDLNERKINLDDDYIKFIRFGQYFIDKNGSGILAYISNNSFIDGITHRQMRKNLLESFDKIYILDLHGNAKKKEVCPDGSIDQNVFDIMQGVSINIFIKTGKKLKNELGQVFHSNIQGKRDFKYITLNESTFKLIQWNKLEYTQPNLFFVPKNFGDIKDYQIGFKIDELLNFVSGIETKRDHFAMDIDFISLRSRISDFVQSDYSTSDRKVKFNLRDNEWIVDNAVIELRKNDNWKNSFVKCLARPFDFRWIVYNSIILSRDRGSLMAGMNKANLGLVLGRQSKEDFAALITNCVCTHKIVTVYDRSFIFPLYLYPDTSQQTDYVEIRRNLEAKLEEAKMFAESFEKTFGNVQKMYEALPSPDEDIKEYYNEQVKHLQKLEANIELFKQQLSLISTQNLFEDEKRKPNLNAEIVKQIAAKLELTFTNEKETTKNTFAPIDILDYIYAVLHSPSYREKYKEFLKIDFPRVPYPTNKERFWQLVSLGGEIRQIHLLESSVVEKSITQYPIDGSNMVIKPHAVETSQTRVLRVYINDTQYFDNVPEIAWNFYLGGYQPAQKWLKDRKDRKLDFDDILHYQKIIVALWETDRLMKEIDNIENVF